MLTRAEWACMLYVVLAVSVESFSLAVEAVSVGERQSRERGNVLPFIRARARDTANA